MKRKHLSNNAVQNRKFALQQNMWIHAHQQYHVTLLVTLSGTQRYKCEAFCKRAN